MLYWTNAPEEYDYPEVVQHVFVQHSSGSAWRLIKVLDGYRFWKFQVPRYQSGLYGALEVGSDEAQAFGLPRNARWPQDEVANREDWREG